MAVLTKEDHLFFEENGYVVLKQAVPKENCDRVIEAIWQFLGKDPADRDEWYTPPKGMDGYMGAQGIGGIEMYHHQSMWDNRQHPRIYQAFTELFNNEKLWVSIDKVGMKPPYRKEYEGLNSDFIHWDMDTTNLPSPLVRPMGLQGVLMLADTAENQGGFQCVPSLYRNIEDYIKNEPADRNPKRPSHLTGYDIIKVPGQAGDMVIWDKLLPHGNGVNLSDQPRFAQYITYNEVESGVSRENQIDSWRSNARYPDKKIKDPRYWEANTYNNPAELTLLGRKLLGLDSWDQ